MGEIWDSWSCFTSKVVEKYRMCAHPAFPHKVISVAASRPQLKLSLHGDAIKYLVFVDEEVRYHAATQLGQQLHCRELSR